MSYIFKLYRVPFCCSHLIALAARSGATYGERIVQMLPRKVSWGVFVCGLSVFGLITGCGSGSGNGMVPVSGKVQLNGTPLPDAEVFFMTESYTGTGRTNAEGEYQLVMGAKPGENKIFITKVEGGDVNLDPEAGMDMGQLDAAGAGSGKNPNQLPGGVKQLVPAEFSDPFKTKLTYNVPEDGASGVNFSL